MNGSQWRWRRRCSKGTARAAGAGSLPRLFPAGHTNPNQNLGQLQRKLQSEACQGGEARLWALSLGGSDLISRLRISCRLLRKAKSVCSHIMTTTSFLFEAFLKCPIKCWLRAVGELPSGNRYADWVKTQNESYRAVQVRRLVAATPEDEYALSPSAENLKAAKWLLAVDVMVATPNLRRNDRPTDSSSEEAGIGVSLGASPPADQANSRQPVFIAETRIHAVERIPSEGRGKAAQFIPIRFIFCNKLTKDDRLLVAFDALVLSEVLGQEVSVGKIIHGDDYAALKVKTPPSWARCEN